ncbi:MAG TPA: tRNA (uridine(34)/cytosine(34)/5-carboxymethylaminomethyluridine(34)-2'-O)-methyltransferase TrmL [Candidatus Eubacterium pullicola]|nr:tRNA (uridine(34)/cytosine(34)/5-carboxymethylaminomethyluridine(34)-2'-O)-methyltransferase TrmL [Candidatus Eubacterium pullicola]
MFHIVFVEPEIPGNTGNIARTCAATGAKLHLVRPLGFNIDDKTVKRAGLDYWQYVDLEVHDSLEAFLKKYTDSRKFLVTTKGSRLYTQPEYKDGDMFLFGRETAGLPKDFIAANQEMTIRIPMSKETRMRSLNLANCGNIILFEALRQMGFPGLK